VPRRVRADAWWDADSHYATADKTVLPLRGVIVGGTRRGRFVFLDERVHLYFHHWREHRNVVVRV
jgi:hypothetical protein